MVVACNTKCLLHEILHFPMLSLGRLVLLILYIWVGKTKNADPNIKRKKRSGNSRLTTMYSDSLFVIYGPAFIITISKRLEFCFIRQRLWYDLILFYFYKYADLMAGCPFLRQAYHKICTRMHIYTRLSFKRYISTVGIIINKIHT